MKDPSILILAERPLQQLIWNRSENSTRKLQTVFTKEAQRSIIANRISSVKSAE